MECGSKNLDGQESGKGGKKGNSKPQLEEVLESERS